MNVVDFVNVVAWAVICLSVIMTCLNWIYCYKTDDFEINMIRALGKHHEVFMRPAFKRVAYIFVCSVWL